MTGKDLYAKSLKDCPNYHDGTPRPAWEALGSTAQWSWNREAGQKHDGTTYQAELRRLNAQAYAAARASRGVADPVHTASLLSVAHMTDRMVDALPVLPKP